MSTLEIILTFTASLMTLLLGGGGIVYHRQSKRSKTAEAFAAEVAALKASQEVWKEQIAFLNARVDDLQRIVLDQDTREHQLRDTVSVLEIKHAKNKSAINTAYGCCFCDTPAKCPVLIARTRNEDEYTAIIEKRAKV